MIYNEKKLVRGLSEPLILLKIFYKKVFTNSQMRDSINNVR